MSINHYNNNCSKKSFNQGVKCHSRGGGMKTNFHVWPKPPPLLFFSQIVPANYFSFTLSLSLYRSVFSIKSTHGIVNNLSLYLSIYLTIYMSVMSIYLSVSLSLSLSLSSFPFSILSLIYDTKIYCRTLFPLPSPSLSLSLFLCPLLEKVSKITKQYF